MTDNEVSLSLYRTQKTIVGIIIKEHNVKAVIYPENFTKIKVPHASVIC